MLKGLLIILGVFFASLIFGALQRRFSPETMANGFMDREKGKEIAPTVFKDKNNNKE